MSFFRVLLALLISGGIAYGLYRAVDGKSLDRVVEAVRTEIAAPLGLETGASADGEETESAALVADIDSAGTDSADTDSTGTDSTEPGSETAAGDETSGTEIASAPAGEIAGETDDGDAATTSATGNDWAAVVMADTGEGTGEADASGGTTVAASGDTVAAADDASPEENVDPDVPSAASTDDTLAVAIATLPELPAQPAVPIADTAVTAAETDGGEIPSLPALAIGAATNDSIKALDVISGGMTYVEARATLIEAGWVPRIAETRATEPNPTETALIEAGYGEIEGCREGERPLCRFEFMDGEKRIAAVLTAGTGTDPSVIDAFLMNIRAE